ncbi:MAG: hypothetical protein ACPG8W_16110 [Candidatus Promineifilaceae bacterium]
MTVIVAKITKTGFEIASDSITTLGSTQSKGQNVSHNKLFEVNGMIIGGTGLAEESSLLRLFANSHRPNRADELAMIEFMCEFSDWKNKKVGKSGIHNHYFISFGGKVFAVKQWFISEVLTYDSIGAGRNFALAAMYLGHSAEKAVETAIELSTVCEAPIQLIKYRKKRTRKKTA